MNGAMKQMKQCSTVSIWTSVWRAGENRSGAIMFFADRGTNGGQYQLICKRGRLLLAGNERWGVSGSHIWDPPFV